MRPGWRPSSVALLQGAPNRCRVLCTSSRIATSLHPASRRRTLNDSLAVGPTPCRSHSSSLRPARWLQTRSFSGTIRPSRKMNMFTAINDAMRVALETDDSAIIIGEDVAFGGVFRCTMDLSDAFPGRVRNTPLCEQVRRLWPRDCCVRTSLMQTSDLNLVLLHAPAGHRRVRYRVCSHGPDGHRRNPVRRLHIPRI